MLRISVLLLTGLLLGSGCTSQSGTEQARKLDDMRRDLELPGAQWDAIVALAAAHPGYEINKAARVSNNTIYMTLAPTEGDSKSPGPTLVFVWTNGHWVEKNVFNDAPMGPPK